MKKKLLHLALNKKVVAKLQAERITAGDEPFIERTQFTMRHGKRTTCTG